MGTPLVFQATCVSMVVAAHWMAPEARARWRSFCGIIFRSTARPFFLKMPALSARVSGAKPVQPDMPRVILVSCAAAGCSAAARQRAAASGPRGRRRNVGIELMWHSSVGKASWRWQFRGPQADQCGSPKCVFADRTCIYRITRQTGDGASILHLPAINTESNSKCRANQACPYNLGKIPGNSSPPWCMPRGCAPLRCNHGTRHLQERCNQRRGIARRHGQHHALGGHAAPDAAAGQALAIVGAVHHRRKSTRLNSSHLVISYAVFCLKKKKTGAYALGL